jgi:L-asparaginase
MRYLSKNEKTTLKILVLGSLISIIVSVYLSLNKEKNTEGVLNSKILVIHLGGDIDSEFDIKYEKIKNHIGIYDTFVYEPLINSSDINLSTWNSVVKIFSESYNNYDAFIILSGRDTLVYTACALSFMLENLQKPVIFTDGDLTNALYQSSYTKIPEVMVLSDKKLLRATKTICKNITEFTSPGYDELRLYNCFQIPNEMFQPKYVNENIKVIVVKIFPGIDEKYLAGMFTNTEVHGIVLETYINGKLPISEKIILALELLIKKGIIIVAVSQCENNNVLYLDSRLINIGIISGHDMTTYTAFSKLCFLLSNVQDKKLVAQLMEQPFRGEITVENPINEISL